MLEHGTAVRWVAACRCVHTASTRPLCDDRAVVLLVGVGALIDALVVVAVGPRATMGWLCDGYGVAWPSRFGARRRPPPREVGRGGGLKRQGSGAFSVSNSGSCGRQPLGGGLLLAECGVVKAGQPHRRARNEMLAGAVLLALVPVLVHRSALDVDAVIFNALVRATQGVLMGVWLHRSAGTVFGGAATISGVLVAALCPKGRDVRRMGGGAVGGGGCWRCVPIPAPGSWRWGGWARPV